MSREKLSSTYLILAIGFLLMFFFYNCTGVERGNGTALCWGETDHCIDLGGK